MASPWRISEQATLISEVRHRARSASEICIPGRSAEAVRRKAARLRLVGDGIARRPWSQAERDTLRRLRAEQWTVAQMCAGPLAAYTPTAVRKQIRRLGLADPRFVAAQRSACRLAGGVLEAFHGFLAANARTCTPEQIALAWNEDHHPAVTHARVLYHLESLGLRPPRRYVLRMAFSKDKRTRSQERSLAALRARSEAMPAQSEQRLRDLTELVRDDPTVAWQTCSDCGEQWPRQPEFFHPYRRHSQEGPRTHLLRRCRLCCNRTRRSA